MRGSATRAALAVSAVASALASIALAAPEASELEAALEVASGSRVALGRGPLLAVTIRNPTRKPIGVEGATGRGRWLPTPRSSIAVTFPGGARHTFAGTATSTALPIPPSHELKLEVWPLADVPVDAPGRWSVSLSLVDSRGAAVKTNFVDFEIAAPPEPSGDLAVSIARSRSRPSSPAARSGPTRSSPSSSRTAGAPRSP
jgi:hypothetical protein